MLALAAVLVSASDFAAALVAVSERAPGVAAAGIEGVMAFVCSVGESWATRVPGTLGAAVVSAAAIGLSRRLAESPSDAPGIRSGVCVELLRARWSTAQRVAVMAVPVRSQPMPGRSVGITVAPMTPTSAAAGRTPEGRATRRQRGGVGGRGGAAVCRMGDIGSTAAACQPDVQDGGVELPDADRPAGDVVCSTTVPGGPLGAALSGAAVESDWTGSRAWAVVSAPKSAVAVSESRDCAVSDGLLPF
ncbi:hypothetical protein ACSVDM_02500 [Nocardia sp. JW2]|uniref:hypothetical protein n=1 Tax=Nocardia sp. JW2 TaxID=3450738 RepID=UPI003F428E3F